MGRRGVEYLLKDNLNRLVGSYDKGSHDTVAVAGRNLHTYLDIELQTLAEKLLKGSPASGYDCHGTYYGCNRPLNCMEKWAGHATSLRLAIAWSCNSFFSDVNLCAKTGTAQNMIVLDGRRYELPDNSTFVCFAPRENPKIAIAVVVENAGAGGTWAGPIASLLVEKYLRDTLSQERLRKVKEISDTDLMPSYFERVQYKADSTRAFEWFKITKDSSYIRNYLKPGRPFVPPVVRKKR